MEYVSTIRLKNGKVTSGKTNVSNKQVCVFDVDGTLTASKTDITQETATLICALMEIKKVAFLAGGTYQQMKTQCVDKLPCIKNKKCLPYLLLFPLSAGSMYRCLDNEWKQVYALNFTQDEKRIVMEAIPRALTDIGYKNPPQIYGETIEDRSAQITFSALGQKAPVEVKKHWHNTKDSRLQLVKALRTYLPDFIIRAGGLTSVDILKVDKSYGIKKIQEVFQVDIPDIIFVGDALYEGGNDYDVLKTGIDAVPVADYLETRSVLTHLLSCQHPLPQTSIPTDAD